MIRPILLAVFVFAASTIAGRAYVMEHERHLIDNPTNVAVFDKCLNEGWAHEQSKSKH